jgi:hypothetical protein
MYASLAGQVCRVSCGVDGIGRAVVVASARSGARVTTADLEEIAAAVAFLPPTRPRSSPGTPRLSTAG